MSNEMYILAMPAGNSVGLGAEGLDEDRKHANRSVGNRHESYNLTGVGLDYAFVEYTDIHDIVDQINPKIPPNWTLKTLEISAHGSPGFCGGIRADNVADIGWHLMQLRWTDDCDLYLAGCNTGLTYAKENITESIAKKLSVAMKFDSQVIQGKFNHHLTVWGSCGYLLDFGGSGGTHMEGNNTASAIYKHQPGSNPEPDAPSYDGARDANGQGCWIPNKNWS